MRDVLNKAVSLGIGLAVASKEQVEKIVDELVKKGEMSRQESLAFIDEWLKKGEESRQKIEAFIQERVQAALGERNWATKEDIERLERRLDELLANRETNENNENRDKNENG